MDFAFIDDIRLQLEDSNIFLYAIKGSKMCAILLLFFSIIERWGKNTLNQNNSLNDLLTIIGYVMLIMSSDFIFINVENTFSSIDSTMSGIDDSLYSDILMTVNENYENMMDGATDWLDMLGAILSNFSFIGGYLLVLFLLGMCKIADMSMVCGYLLTRIFFLEVLTFLFPIAVALSTIKQTSGLIAKWLKLYIGVSLLGIIYIGIIKLCSITQSALHSSFLTENSSDFFDAYLNMNLSIWGGIVTLIVVFTLKVALFNKTTSFIISFFN